jgi:hypothetical protein
MLPQYPPSQYSSAASGVVELGVHSASAAGASSSDTVPDWSQRRSWNHVRPGRLPRPIYHNVATGRSGVAPATNLAPMALPLSERSARSIGAVCDHPTVHHIGSHFPSRAVFAASRFRGGRRYPRAPSITKRLVNVATVPCCGVPTFGVASSGGGQTEARFRYLQKFANLFWKHRNKDSREDKVRALYAVVTRRR